MHLYEVHPRKDTRGFDLSSDRRISSESVIEIIASGLVNALSFAMPQFAWFAATALCHFSGRVCDATLVGLT